MENNDKDLEFVSRHYKENRLDTDKAWEQLAGRTGMPKPRRTIYRKAIAASAAVVLGFSMALAFDWISIFPARQSTEPAEVVAAEPVARPIIEAKDSTVLLRYDNEPVGKILRELSAYYSKNVTTADSTRCVSGEIEASSLDEIVGILEATLNINISVE